MRRFPTAPVILVVAVAGLIAGWFIFFPVEKARYQQVSAVRRQRSEIHLIRRIRYGTGNLAQETLQLDNVDGVSTASYAVQDRRGYVARFTEPLTGYDVTFAFDLLVRDGIWELQTQCPKGADATTVYDVRIAQIAGNRSGAHRFSFCDPKYLASKAGRTYEIHLDKNKPVPNLLTLQSKTNADARYEKIVVDFSGFGTPRFRATVATARAKVREARPRSGKG